MLIAGATLGSLEGTSLLASLAFAKVSRLEAASASLTATE